MPHFTNDFNHFFKQLAAHNDRDWFHAHKADYERQVKQPFEQFVREVIAALAAEDPAIKNLDSKDAIFRIHRDTRFSPDKTPYKLFASAVIAPQGRKDLSYPGTYFQFGVGEIWIGGGSYMPSKEQIEQIRQAMIAQPERVERLVADADFKRLFGHLQGEQNKRLLKPFSEWQSRLPLVANKQFYYMATYNDDESFILQDNLLDRLLEHYRAARGWQQFLIEALQKPLS